MGIWYTLLLGQVYALLVLLTTVAWLLLKADKQIAAGLLLGLLVAFKPNFAFWPFLLLLSGYYQVVIIAGVVAVSLSAIPLISFGPGIYSSWLNALASCPAVGLATNASIYGVMARFGLPWLANLLATLIFIGLAVLTWRRRPSATENSALALTGMLLATPFVWAGYLILLLPVMMSRLWSARLVIAAVLLLVPAMFIAAAEYYIPSGRLLAGLAYPLVLILVLWDLVSSILKPASTAL
jgi:alpha-1,2-mannosyltransferase/arabinofuranan 3-O-arabinosyltransferase